MNHQIDMNHQDWLAQADIYVLEALDSDELLAFEAHLAEGCLVCEQHLRQTREALTLLPRALEPITPPSTLRTRLLAQIDAEAATPLPTPHLSRRRWWKMGVSALVAAGLLVALSFELYRTRQKVQHLEGLVASLEATMTERAAALQAQQRELQRATELVSSLQAELAARAATLEAARQERESLERVVATLQGELTEREAALRLLATPQVGLVRLTGASPSLRANAHLLWNPAAQTGVLLTSGLPQIPRDRVYELWAFAGNEPVPAGIFQVDEVGHAFLRLPPLPRGKRYGKFAVTSEPAGGVPKPTGPVHLVGSL